MKKFFFIAIGILVSLFILISALDPKVKISSKEEVINKLDTDQTFLLVIGQSTCASCVKYKQGTLTKYVDENRAFPLVFTYSDKKFSNSDEFASFLDKYGIEYNASPTTYLVKNGNIIANVEGNIDLPTLLKFIEDNRYN